MIKRALAVYLGVQLGFLAIPAQAALVVVFEEVGSDVIVTASGSINLSGLQKQGGAGSLPALVIGLGADEVTGSPLTQRIDNYFFANGPASFGDGARFDPDSGSGAQVGLFGNSKHLFVPAGYVSGTTLSSSATI